MARISYSRVLEVQRIPIDAQDLVTRARVVIVAQATKERLVSLTAKAPDSSTVVPYLPEPVAVSATLTPHHSSIQATRSFSLPDTFDPFLPATHPSIPDPVGSVSDMDKARDGDPTTYASWGGLTTAGMSYTITDHNVMMAGARILYDLDTSDGSSALLAVNHSRETSTGVQVGVQATYELPPTDSPTEVVVFVPPPQWNDASPPATFTLVDKTQNVSISGRNVNTFRVYEFIPLLVNLPLVQSVARAQLRMYASNPRRVTVKGIVPPGDVEHVIVGWPGGDFTGPVARQSYVGGTTVIDFEQAGAPPGLTQEAVEAERVRLARTRDLIRSATYPSLIGR